MEHQEKKGGCVVVLCLSFAVVILLGQIGREEKRRIGCVYIGPVLGGARIGMERKTCREKLDTLFC